MGNEVDFSHSDKHESFLEISTMNGQAFPKFPKQQACNVFTTYQKQN